VLIARRGLLRLGAAASGFAAPKLVEAQALPPARTYGTYGSAQRTEASRWLDFGVSVKEFKAVGDGVTDDAPAFQSMCNYIQTSNKLIPIIIPPGRYYLKSSVALPTISTPGILKIIGLGAELYSDKAIHLLDRLPTSHSDNQVKFGQCTYHIEDISFTGSRIANQVGLALGGVYTPVVERCYFTDLDIGLAGLSCLNGTWRNLMFADCLRYPMILESGVGNYSRLGWDDSNDQSQSNVNLVQSCRVYGDPGQVASYTFHGSDSIRMHQCISEGAGANFDVLFDYGDSTTVKFFEVDGLHSESASTKCYFRIRAAGLVNIRNVFRQTPAALLDASGSNVATFRFHGWPYIGAMPAGGVGARWFYHTNGNGIAGPEAGANSSGSVYEFDQMPVDDDWQNNVTNPTYWENNSLGLVRICTYRGANGGFSEYNDGQRTFHALNSPLTLDAYQGLAFGSDTTISNPNIMTGAGVPGSTRPIGSIFIRTDGTVGATIYVSAGGGTWNAIAGV
jgi:hypothetical protein